MTEAEKIRQMIGEIIPPVVDVQKTYSAIPAAIASPGMTPGAVAELLRYQTELAGMMGRGQTQYTVGGNSQGPAPTAANTATKAPSFMERFSGNLQGDNKQIAGQPSTGDNQFGPAKTDLDLMGKIQAGIGNVGFAVLGIGLVIFAAAGPILYRKFK